MRSPDKAWCCFVGEVRHRRLRPVEHQFSYRSFFFRLDAGLLDPALTKKALQLASPVLRDEQADTNRSSPEVIGSSTATSLSSPETIRSGEHPEHAHGNASLMLGHRWLPLFGVNRTALISMHAEDHGSERRDLPLSQWLLGLLNAHHVPRPSSIRLLAYPRVLGYQFKPVSFWFCDDDKGDCLAIVAEVRNTFSGRHAYVLTPHTLERALGEGLGSTQILKNGQTLSTNKCFTVSPFCTISGSYRFRFFNDETRSLSRIEYHDDKGLLLITSLSGERIALSSQRLFKLTLAIPWQSLMVILRIHWQALKLWLKKVPFYGAQQSPSPPQSLPSQGT